MRSPRSDSYPRTFVALLVVLAVTGAYSVREAARAGDLIGTVSPVAGSGRAGYGGDSGAATDGELNQPRMATFDSAGRMYIADTFNNVVRVVDTDGTMGTVAGIPLVLDTDDESLCSKRYSGDGGPALEAKLSCPHSLAVSPSGRLAIADSANHRIREVDKNGIIRTIAGTGSQGFSGDNGPAVSAKLSNPKGIIYDAAGNLLIADTSSNRIRKVTPDGIIMTIVGSGAHGSAGDGGPALEAELWEPRTLALGPNGEIYFTEPRINRVRKVDANGIISLVAGTTVQGFAGDGGPAVDAQLFTPRGIDVDAAGVVYIADSQNDRVRQIGLDGIITTIGGTGQPRSQGDGGLASAAAFFGPRAVTVFGNDLYVTDTNGHRVRRINGITAGPSPRGTGATTVVTTSSSTSTTTSTSSTTTTTKPTTSTTKPTTSSTTSTTPTGEDPPTVPSGQNPTTPSRLVSGYWMLGSGGDVYAFGAARHHGNAGPLPPGVSTVDLEPTPSGAGYWVLASDGTVRGFGDATLFGNVAPAQLRAGEQVTSLSATPSGTGYWVFSDRGRAIAFGDAAFRGDVSSLTLNGPVLDSVATPSGKGYYMVASDGGIFSFGDATFHGSTGSLRLNKPVIGMAPSSDGAGYWLVASDGGIFAFDVPFRGSMGSTRLNKPITGLVPGNDGYLMVAEDGGIFAFGAVAFHGSLGAKPPASPVVSAALMH